MKNICKIVLVVISSLLIVFSLASCGAKEYDGGLDYNKSSSISEEPSLDLSDDITEQKIVTTTSTFSCKTKEFEDKVKSLKENVIGFGGYFSQFSTSGEDYESYSSKTVSAIAKVPADKYSSFVNYMNDNFTVVTFEETQDDITSSYIEAKSHYDTLKVEETRLNELLAQAQGIDEILTIEDRLQSIRQSLSYYDNIIKTYDNKVSYATVNIKIQKVFETPEPKEPTYWDEVKESFTESWANFAEFWKGFSLFVIELIPVLVALAIFGAFGLVIFLIIFFSSKKAKKKKQSKQA